MKIDKTEGEFDRLCALYCLSSPGLKSAFDLEFEEEGAGLPGRVMCWGHYYLTPEGTKNFYLSEIYAEAARRYNALGRIMALLPHPPIPAEVGPTVSIRVSAIHRILEEEGVTRDG